MPGKWWYIVKYKYLNDSDFFVYPIQTWTDIAAYNWFVKSFWQLIINALLSIISYCKKIPI